MKPTNGWVELGADWTRRQGWELYGEVGRRWTRFDLAARGWWQPQQSAAGVAVVGRF